MKKRNILLIIAAVVVVVFAVLVLHKPRTETPLQPKPMASVVQPSNSEVRVASNNSVANQPHAAVASSQNTSIPPDIEARYRQGLISKDEAIAETYNLRFKQPRSFYGKVIDQYGQPVVGVEVTGSIEMLNDSGDGLQTQTFETQSDSEGLFDFTGKTGAPIKFTIKKEGYMLGARGEGYKGPPSEQTTPDNRAILTMWKLHGPEKLIGSSIDANIPHDGSPVTFDMTTGKESSNGDLRAAISQFPLDVKTGRERFDWSVKVELINGGLLEENDPYPYWAPANGYQPSFEFNVSSNAPEWVPNLKKSFYAKNAQGQYGIMRFSVYPGRSPTGLEVNFNINPSGSQNLEPDQAGQP
jgi:hypothetical protein